MNFHKEIFKFAPTKETKHSFLNTHYVRKSKKAQISFFIHQVKKYFLEIAYRCVIFIFIIAEINRHF